MPVPQGTIGPYTLEKLLGSGGMSEVYQAYDHRLQRRVAIKQLQNGSDADAGSRERFLHEARSVARLSHPSIIQIHDILEDESGDWIVMERIDGPTVAELVAQGPLPVARAVSIGRQVAEGLVEAHDQGILHRDLKSENVMLARGDRAKILDFGLAKRLWPGDGEASLSGQGRVLGTCRAMSPEQARDQTLDPRSDLFALGVLLYEMLTGQSPFHADNHTDTLTRVCHFHPPPVTDRHPEVPVELAALVDRLLQKDRQKRPQSAHEVAEVLAALDAQLSPSGSGSASGPVVESGPIVPRQSITPGWVTESVYLNRLRTSLPRRWLWWGAGGVAVALALVVALVMWMRNREAVPTIQVRPSVAVLGLKNVTGDPDSEWIGRAIVEALNAELAAGEQLRTVPSESLSLARQELDLRPDTLTAETLSKLRSRVGADHIVVGSFTVTPETSDLHTVVYVQDTLTAETLEPVNEIASVDKVVELGHQLGTEVRQRLGVGVSSLAARRAATATLPTSNEAGRYYFDGLKQLEEHEFVGAREQLEKAVKAEPDFPLSHAALAKALSALGLDGLARGAAARAAELAGDLPKQDRQFVRARDHEMSWRWEAAIEGYRTLLENYSDNIEYGLSLAGALVSSGQGAEALATLEQLRRLPSSVAKDPRLDLAEIKALWLLSRYEELLIVATRAERSGEELGARILTASVCLEKAFALLRLGRPSEAFKAAEKARRLYREAADPLGEALALNRIGNVYYDSGDCSKARPIFEDFLARMQESGHKNGLASALNNVASCLTVQGDLATTERLLRESIDLADEVGDLTQSALGRVNLAELQLRYGNLDTAQRILDDLSEQAEKTKFPYAGNFTRIVQGLVYLFRGEVSQARAVLVGAHEAISATGDPRYISFSHHTLGTLEWLAGDLTAGQDHFRQALTQRRALKDQHLVAQTEVGLGWTLLEQSPRESLGLAQHARSTFHGQSSPEQELEAAGLEIAALLALGKTGDLESPLLLGEDLLEGCESLLTRLSSGIHLARGWQALGQSGRAKKSLEEIRQQAADHGLVPLELEAMLALADLEEAEGRAIEAQDLRQEVSRQAETQRLGNLQRKADSGLGPS